MKPKTHSAVIFLLFGALALAGGVPEAIAQAGSDARGPPEGEHLLSGTVTRSDSGTAVSGATVTAYTEGPDGATKGSATTDENGRFEIRLNSGKGQIWVYHSGYTQWSEDLLLEGDRHVKIHLTPPPPQTARLEGRVLGPAGEAIANAHVTLGTSYVYATEARMDSREEPARIAAPEHSEWNETRTDADGAFSFNAYPGSKEIRAEAKGFATAVLRIELQAGETREATLRLEKVPDMDATLNGRVVDAQTGAPIPGAQVSLNNFAWSHYAYAVTNERGEYELRTYPGYVQIWISAYRQGDVVVLESEASSGESGNAVPAVAKSMPPGSGQTSIAPARNYYSWTEAVLLEKGERSLDAKLKPKPEATIVLAGWVIDDRTEKGIPGAWIGLRNEDTGEYGGAQTDADGSFRILLRAGYHVLDASAAGHFSRSLVFEVDGPLPQKLVVRLTEGEPRYVPCPDCYAEPAHAAAENRDASAPPPPAAPAPGPAPAPRSDVPAGLMQMESGGVAKTGGSQAYAGSGGGLGAYSAQKAATPPAESPPPTAPDRMKGTERSDPELGVPAQGLLAALVVLGLGAAGLRRKA